MKMRTKLNELHDLRPLNNRAKISLKGGKVEIIITISPVVILNRHHQHNEAITDH